MSFIIIILLLFIIIYYCLFYYHAHAVRGHRHQVAAAARRRVTARDVTKHQEVKWPVSRVVHIRLVKMTTPGRKSAHFRVLE